MQGFNTKSRLSLDGYLGDVPLMQYTPTGKAVIDLSIAIGGSKEYPGRWYKATFWQADAELVNSLALKKGVAVSVAGNLVEADAWIGKDGKARGKPKLGWIDLFSYEDGGGQMVEVELPGAGGNQKPVPVAGETAGKVKA